MTTFKINKDKEESADILISVFTFWGRHDFEDKEGYPMIEVEIDDPEEVFTLVDAFAVKVQRGDKTQCYVKRGRYGKLFNPIGMYSEGTAHKQMRHAGKPEWRFEASSEKIFDYYIQFLKTKNLAWLHNAEREV